MIFIVGYKYTKLEDEQTKHKKYMNVPLTGIYENIYFKDSPVNCFNFPTLYTR